MSHEKKINHGQEKESNTKAKKKKKFPESRHTRGKMARDSFMGDMNEGHYCLGVGRGGFGGTIE